MDFRWIISINRCRVSGSCSIVFRSQCFVRKVIPLKPLSNFERSEKKQWRKCTGFFYSFYVLSRSFNLNSQFSILIAILTQLNFKSQPRSRSRLVRYLLLIIIIVVDFVCFMCTRATRITVAVSVIRLFIYRNCVPGLSCCCGSSRAAIIQRQIRIN